MNLFRERLEATVFHALSTLLISYNKGWGMRMLWFIFILVLRGSVDSGLVRFLLR
jgi:hypothetical protein